MSTMLQKVKKTKYILFLQITGLKKHLGEKISKYFEWKNIFKLFIWLFY